MIKKTLYTCLIICLLSTPLFAKPEAKTPLQSIKMPTEKIIHILKDPKYKQLTPDLKEEQWNKIWGIVKDSFDFGLISRLALGRYWKKFSNDQSTQFKRLFAELLGNTYISKIQDNFTNQKIAYIKEKIKEKRAAVLVHVELTSSKPVPMIYKLIKKKKWLIYDVKIEGMSMLKNYRSQFNDFLFKKTPEQLLSVLDKKIKTLRVQRKTIKK